MIQSTRRLGQKADEAEETPAKKKKDIYTEGVLNCGQNCSPGAPCRKKVTRLDGQHLVEYNFECKALPFGL